ncbi:FAD-binding monooxygenase [Leucobacter sp. CSA2]|uniref:FAD-binding monooxygenase n=1 Tax=Leucobacter edaphi TaxID=2796472 RepID=A0A934QFB2_9MICO|nr:FAD-binding monooxygenase [Leucobacter edaphi]
MQFHHHGYVSTDPRVQPAAGVGRDRPDDLPSEIDVLIVGSGPAGVITAAQLAQFPGVVTRIVERRDQRLIIGQADGIQARSVETFQAFGFAEQIIQEAYQITEMAFWKPNPEKPEDIIRTAVTPDDPNGISEFPHLIVNQARIIDYFNEFAERSPARSKVDYGYEFVGLEVAGTGEYPVAVTLRRTAGERKGEELTVHAKYVVGADGAKSGVRHAIGGSLAGDQSYHAWGVMDVLATTDFPDIRKKCAIQSEDGGNILHIPREGNYLFRMYVDLGEVDENDNGKVRETSIDEIIARANKIIHPYRLDVRNVAWHSVYEVAHRLTDRFDDAHAPGEEKRCPRVFLMGDACHTHSAKAGQGMNVSMQDGWNLGWKLGYVLEGRAPEALLETYSDERQVIAKNLIDFDKEWSTLMAKRPEEFNSPSELEDFYVSTAEFPAGFMTQYQSGPLTATSEHQSLAEGFPIGKRFRSERTTRVSDAVDVHIGHHHRADGRFRIYAFADRDATAMNEWAEWMLSSPESPVQRFTPLGADVDSLFDVKAIYQQDHHDVDPATISKLFLPLTGPFELVDYEKVYATKTGDVDIFETRGVSRDGAVVVVRPDHYVAAVLPFSATKELADYFAGFLSER